MVKTHRNRRRARYTKSVDVGLLKNVRLLRRCAPHNDKGSILASLRAIQRIARQSQAVRWNFFNNPTSLFDPSTPPCRWYYFLHRLLTQ